MMQLSNAKADLPMKMLAHISLYNLTKLKQAEKANIEKGRERHPLLLNRLFEIEKAINANRAAQKKNRVIGLVSSVLGNLLLLFTNLIAKSGA